MQARLLFAPGGDVFRQHWRERDFWAWWWQRSGSATLRAAATVGAGLLIGALGVFSADRLTSAKKRNEIIVWTTTVKRTTTVHTKGPAGRAATRVRVVTVRVVHNGPRAETRARTAVVTTTAKPILVTRTVIDKHTVTRLKQRLVTRTVTRSVTQVPSPVTVTLPPVTMTETLPAQTVTVTTTIKHGH